MDGFQAICITSPLVTTSTPLLLIYHNSPITESVQHHNSTSTVTSHGTHATSKGFDLNQ
jgi:hypothetical protein